MLDEDQKFGYIITGDLSMAKTAFDIEQNCLNNSHVQVFDLFENKPSVLLSLADTQQVVLIKYDLDSMQLNLYDTFVKFLKDNQLEHENVTSEINMRLFTSQVVNERYDELDMLQKYVIKKMITELVFEYMSRNK